MYDIYTNNVVLLAKYIHDTWCVLHLHSASVVCSIHSSYTHVCISSHNGQLQHASYAAMHELHTATQLSTSQHYISNDIYQFRSINLMIHATIVYLIIDDQEVHAL